MGRLPLCCYVPGLQEGGPHDYYPCYTEADIIWARRVKFHNERPRNPYTCRKTVARSFLVSLHAQPGVSQDFIQPSQISENGTSDCLCAQHSNGKYGFLIDSKLTV